MPNQQEHQQWLGFEVDGQKLALPLSSVASVFHSVSSAEQDKAYGLEVYEGVPVFLLPPEKLFQLSNLEKSFVATPLSWIIVLRTNEDAQIGFRVHKTIGPFHAVKNQLNQIEHLEQTLHVVNPLENNHG